MMAAKVMTREYAAWFVNEGHNCEMEETNLIVIVMKQLFFWCRTLISQDLFLE